MPKGWLKAGSLQFIPQRFSNNKNWRGFRR